MTRVKRGVATRKRHKKVLKLAKGYRWGRSKLFNEAKRAIMKAGQYAYAHRRAKKRDFRALWIIRISAALKLTGVLYSRFTHNATIKKININRKMLADLAMNHAKVFERIKEVVMG